VIRDPLAVAAVVAAVAALAFVLDRRVPALSKVGASLLCIVFGAALSNLGVVPATSPVYDGIGGPVTSLAIAWLLLAVNLSDVRRAGPRVMGAFALACAGTAVGAFVGALLFAGAFGTDGWRLAGTLAGSYSGGSVNFVAVGRGLELPDALFAGATAADNLTTGLWLGATLLLPLWLGRFYPAIPEGLRDPTGAQTGDPTAPAAEDGHHPFFARTPLSTLDLAVLVAVGLVLLQAAELLGRLTPAIPSVLWLTTLALAVGQLAWFRAARGALQLGNVALHLFFVVIGIYSRIDEIVAVGIEVFFFTLVVVGVHGVVVYGVGRWAKLDVATLSVASQAAVGGPSSALAVAVSRRWRGLILPGILVGLIGYAVGNYLGFAVAWWIRGAGIGL
jgi:uncharacterized membrane protein